MFHLMSLKNKCIVKGITYKNNKIISKARLTIEFCLKAWAWEYILLRKKINSKFNRSFWRQCIILNVECFGTHEYFQTSWCFWTRVEFDSFETMILYSAVFEAGLQHGLSIVVTRHLDFLVLSKQPHKLLKKVLKNINYLIKKCFKPISFGIMKNR